MKKAYWKLIGATATLTLLAASALPQSGPIGKRGGGGGGGSSSGGGGGSRGNSNGGGGSHGGGSGGGSNGGGGWDGGSRGGRRGGGDSGGSGGGSSNDGGGSSGGWQGGGGTRSGGNGGGGIIISGDQDGGTRRQHSSRSGRVNYGSSSNVFGMPEGTRSSGPRIERINTPIIVNNGQLQRRVGQSERRVGLIYNGYRSGYYHYRRDWRDDYFCYPHYCFDPFEYDRCVVSPWYYYMSLPAYVSYSRVIIVSSFPTNNWYGTSYRWRPIDRYDRYARYEDVDYAIQDIVDAFEDGNRRAMDRLCPARGNVNIYTEGNYSYSLNADDFYDLFEDGIENVRTVRYEITDVQRNRDGNVRVLARHEYIDPWGNRQTVWHNYYLERDRRDYVIREFGTSYYRSGW